MNNKNGIISIIVPIYKVEHELNRCVQSILHQTYQQLEIILVDDGSPDNCPAMCDQYAQEDLRVRVVHKENGGLSDARNAGLHIATGEYILYVDSDDYIEYDACEQLISAMKDDTDIVVGACREIKGNKTSYQRHTNLVPGKKYDAKEYVIKSIKKNEWYFPAWLNLYRRKFLWDNNLFFQNGILYEDMEITIRLWTANPKIRYINYPFYNYIQRNGSIMNRENNEVNAQISISILNNWKKIIDKEEDKEFQKYLYGILVRYYIATCRSRNIFGWKIDGIDFTFSLHNALNPKEKLKVIFFAFISNLINRK
ncbi:glycosyltransferase family 2 protein [Bifidobacterium felsineum]|uniref:Glycosyl transferase family 2 n=1 Tax=Bifidobacterium felsineum TaxID=2045440 RepID=A0A2M9HHW9_9BIFI|nr:glycosyltransferase [Bifidobacterium felsineum]PJM76393.1 glycosyl transferase family 2 [Bifidobacterium felsineum]